MEDRPHNGHAGAPERNFFAGRVAFGSAHEMSLAPFYSAAEIPGRGGSTWAFAGADGQVRLIEKDQEPVAAWKGWGSNIVSLRGGCGKGWQLLATKPGDGMETDAVQAYEVSCLSRSAHPWTSGDLFAPPAA